MALSARALAYLLAALIALFALAPHTFAQSASGSDDLRATIRAELLSDPRTSNLPQAQLDAMVDALTAQAQEQGLTAHDITWRPAMTPAENIQADACGSMPSVLCALNRAFGFDGSDPRIPVGLGIVSALLILIIGLMFEMHHRKAAVAAAAVPPAPSA